MSHDQVPEGAHGRWTSSVSVEAMESLADALFEMAARERRGPREIVIAVSSDVPSKAYHEERLAAYTSGYKAKIVRVTAEAIKSTLDDYCYPDEEQDESELLDRTSQALRRQLGGGMPIRSVIVSTEFLQNLPGSAGNVREERGDIFVDGDSWEVLKYMTNAFQDDEPYALYSGPLYILWWNGSRLVYLAG